MNKYTDQPEATRILAAGQSHGDLHSGRGVISMPSHDAIAHRAYDIYVKHGRQSGHCEQNWLKAEHELKTAAHRV